MSLTTEQVRLLGIALLNQESDRDRQVTIGASDLSNGCDRCLANRMMGRKIINPRADSLWLGREMGTSIHLRYQSEVEIALAKDHLDIDLAPLLGGKSEEHLPIGTINGYGLFGGTIDLSLEDAIDIKGSTRKKSCLLNDYLAIAKGEEAPFGRTHAQVKLSQRKYDEQMKGMTYKVDGYYGQLSIYGLARERAGRPVTRCHILWVNRDGNGIFDVPGGARFDDPKAVHDIWALSFEYDRAYALSLIARGQSIWDRIQEGAGPADFEAASYCFPCSIETESERRDLDIEATMAVAA